MGTIKKTTVTAILAVLLAIAILPFLQLHTVKAAEGTPTVHYVYVDENGTTELAVENGRDWESDTTTTPAFLIYDIEGYAYVKTTLKSVDGNEIRPILRRNSSGVWQVHDFDRTTGCHHLDAVAGWSGYLCGL